MPTLQVIRPQGEWFDYIEALLARVQARVASAVAGDSAFHAPVVAVAVNNVLLTSLTPIDGVVVVDGSRVLVANNNIPAENGIWVTHAGAWTRPADWASGSTRVKGEQIQVAPGGTTFPRFGSNWMLTNTIVVDAGGSDPIIFPAIDKGPIVIGGGGTTALANLWVFDATATGFATDITVGAVGATNFESIAAGAGDGRGNGTATIAGTAGHTVAIEVVNF